MRETEIGAVAKGWLEGRGLEVFQEVETPCGSRIDLVGRADHRLVAVECKLGFGLDVIAQAKRWVTEAHESWVAVRLYRQSPAHRMAEELCESLGIGVLQVVAPRLAVPWLVRVDAASRIPKSSGITLHAEQRDAAPAGTNRGGHSTAFKRTCAALVETVKGCPGITLKDAARYASHHYRTRASAVASLSEALNRTHSTGKGRVRPAELAAIRIEGVGAKATLWPAEEGVF